MSTNTAGPNIGRLIDATLGDSYYQEFTAFLRAFDGMAQPAVIDKDLANPPANPANGDRYIVGANPGGAWAGKEKQIARWYVSQTTPNGAWEFFAPRVGWLVSVVDELGPGNIPLLYGFTGTAWAVFSSGLSNPMTTASDLIVGAAAGAPARLPVGGAGQALIVQANGSLAWGNIPASGMANPMTAPSDLIVGGVAGAPARLPVGSAGQVLVVQANGSLAWAAPAISAIGRNLLTNGDFRFNQRGFAGGALAAGIYGFDRWGAYVNGASYTVSATGVVTLASGEICQPVESAGLGGASVSVSVDSPSANLTVTLGTSTTNVSGVIAAGAGRRSVKLVVPAGLTGDLQVRLSGTNVSFSKVKMEEGNASPWESPRNTPELLECQRFYQKSYRLATPPGSGGGSNYQGIIDYFAASPSTTQINVYVKLGVTMRSTPTVTLYDLAGAIGKVYRGANGATADVFGVGEGSFNGVARAGASASEVAFHWTAEAELACTN